MGNCIAFKHDKQQKMGRTGSSDLTDCEKYKNLQGSHEISSKIRTKSTLEQQSGISNNNETNNKQQQQDDDQLFSASVSKIYRNTDHSIMKKSGKGQINQQQGLQSQDQTKSSSKIQGDQPCNIGEMEGVIHQQLQYSKITIYDSTASMEFTIPKASAGPLVVPFLDYEDYINALGICQKQ